MKDKQCLVEEHNYRGDEQMDFDHWWRDTDGQDGGVDKLKDGQKDEAYQAWVGLMTKLGLGGCSLDVFERTGDQEHNCVEKELNAECDFEED